MGGVSLNLDWRRMKVVVIESDDWGLCAWSADEQAWRVLAGTPAFRTPAGRRYAGSTLESAEDVRQLAATLAALRGGDGLPPVLQANTVMAAPAFERLRPPQFECSELPLTTPTEASTRWHRPGLERAIDDARDAGLWWPELHGLHHIPEHAWLTALRRGADDARLAHEQHSPVCQAVEASGEYDPSEPRDLRGRNLRLAVERFRARFGRGPASLCPPDYRWDEALEADAESLGVTMLQGLGEQAGHRFPRLRRTMLRRRWPNRRGARFYLPPRIVFEPSAWLAGEQPSRIEAARRAVRDAWGRGQPAMLCTHRVNYAHLQLERSGAGRSALRDLLAGLVEDGAAFLTDDEVRQLHERSVSVRPIGASGAIVRCHGVPVEPVRFPVPTHATRAIVRDRNGHGGPELTIEDGHVVARLGAGVHRIDWGR
jgi:hypothetical protein